MHNLGVVSENASRTPQELSRLAQIPSDQIQDLLRRHEDSGYLGTVPDPEGRPRYFLTGKGIIRVCSVFT
jgi:hypothetical protein